MNAYGSSWRELAQACSYIAFTLPLCLGDSQKQNAITASTKERESRHGNKWRQRGLFVGLGARFIGLWRKGRRRGDMIRNARDAAFLKIALWNWLRGWLCGLLFRHYSSLHSIR